MPGFADYLAEASVNFITGQAAMPSLGARYLALFTAAPTNDAGTGGTEVSGGAYARQQVAGEVSTTSATASGSVLTFSGGVPAWIVSGMTVTDLTTPGAIPTATTVGFKTSTQVTISNPVTGGGVGSGDNLCFSAWPAASASSGTEPAVTPSQATNSAAIGFAAATANWGNVLAFGIYDAATGGDLLLWDYLGPNAWQPATMSSASPGVVTCHAHGFTTASFVVVSTKFSGALPSFSQSNLTGVLVPANVTTDTVTLTNGGTAVNTSSTGDFNIRAIQQQSIPQGVTASFAASSFPVAVA